MISKNNKLYGALINICLLVFLASCEQKNDANLPGTVVSKNRSDTSPKGVENDSYYNKNFNGSKSADDKLTSAIRNTLKKRLEGSVGNSIETKNKFTKHWFEIKCDSMNRPIDTEEETVKLGIKLPDEASIILSDNMQIDDAIEKKSMPFTLNYEEFQFSLHRLVLAYENAINFYISLPKLIEEQDRSLPPKYSDLANFLAFSAAMQELPATGINSIPLDSWQQLSNDANPIYRLLAIRGAGYSTYFSSDQPLEKGANPTNEYLVKKLGFFLKFLNEQDSYLASEAAFQIGNLGLKEGEEKLIEFMQSDKVKSNNALGKSVKGAIRQSYSIRELKGK